VVHALPSGRFSQSAIQIDPDPALLIGRPGGRGALGRSRLRRSLAKIDGGRLLGEEGTEPREHDQTVGIGRAGARTEVGAAPRAALAASDLARMYLQGCRCRRAGTDRLSAPRGLNQRDPF